MRVVYQIYPNDTSPETGALELRGLINSHGKVVIELHQPSNDERLWFTMKPVELAKFTAAVLAMGEL